MKDHVFPSARARLRAPLPLMILFPALAAGLAAQTAPAAGARTAAPSPTEETIELSPFVVNTDRDTGFVATSALAGGRLATDLRYLKASRAT